MSTFRNADVFCFVFNMYIVAAFLLLGTVLTVNSERHSLTYIYTAFSKPVGLPGIHEFSAMGLLDDRMIDYYDSTIQRKIPKQPWMVERLDADYWEKGTRSRQSKEQWFKVNINILMKRMRQNDTDSHILQWRHGCVVDMQPDGSTKFKKGMDMYSYDGEDFLSFDDTNSRWIAPVPSAVPTQKKWDEVRVLNDYTKGYLEKECVDWLSKFLKYGNEQLQNASAPDVYVFAKKAKIRTITILTCMATGFYPKDIILMIKRNGRQLTELDGLFSTGVRPNGDNTHQIKMTVEILNTDSSNYTCEVNHRASNMHVVKEWDHTVHDSDSAGIIGVSVGLVLVSLIIFFVVFFLMYRMKKGPFGEKCDTVSTDSGKSSLGSENEKASLTGSKCDTVSTDSGKSSLESENEKASLTGENMANSDTDSVHSTPSHDSAVMVEMV